MKQFDDATDICPLVGILRGLTPQMAGQVGQVLYQEGLRVLEVPINSPEPFRSIATLRKTLPEDCVIGAGTLMTAQNLQDLKASGGTLAVMPHTDTALIQKALNLGLLPMPGVFTPSEMFSALSAGATHLKLFPANVIGQDLVKAVRSVLPPSTKLYAVGGINSDSLVKWKRVDGFGLGSSLFTPSDTIEMIQSKASRLVAAAQIWTQER